MAEYIKREALIDDFRHCGAGEELVETIVHRISLHPAADVAPVVHGKWITLNIYYGMYECSACGMTDQNCAGYGQHESHMVLDQDYCPNCGAKMDGDKEAT